MKRKSLQKVNRLIGEYEGKEEGPLAIFFGGLHGNEPSGILALRKVFKQLHGGEVEVKGKVIGIAGNISALKSDMRFIDHDLNRLFSKEKVESVLSGKAGGLSEEEDLYEILKVMNEHTKPFHPSLIYFLDLHTTSSESQPYVSLVECEHIIEFTNKFPAHMVCGTDSALQGTLGEYMVDRGYTGATFEAGQHYDLSSIEAQEAAIWLTLCHAGMLEPQEYSGYYHQYGILAKDIIEGKKIFKVDYRYEIKEGENFSMEPGYVNFQPIEKGQLIAKNANGPILSEWNAHIFMPLYQGWGNDGFFIISEDREQLFFKRGVEQDIKSTRA